MSSIHDRMPVVLPRAMWDTWLDPTNQRIDVLSRLLVPAPDDLLEMHEVSTEVNNVRNKGDHLIAPV
jgi:putative SOS response-associated peptidase YedK